MKADDLLAAIPEEWRDVVRDDLLGLTPRQVVEEGHIDSSPGSPGCLMCRHVLVGLGVERNR